MDCTEDGKTTSVAHWLDEDDFKGNGGVMNHETLDSIAKRKKPFTVDYAGFGWLLIKHGVFEDEGIKYPWFAPKMQIFESGAVQDMCGEDVSFCLDAKEAGFRIMCDPRIRVGHEKPELYSISYKGEVLHENLSRDEYFEKMQDLADEFFKNGTPHPLELDTDVKNVPEDFNIEDYQ